MFLNRGKYKMSIWGKIPEIKISSPKFQAYQINKTNFCIDYKFQ